MMSDLDAILATVLDRPDDDIPRLVYADRLEDTGEPANVARAEFIRVQIRIAEIERDTAGNEWHETGMCSPYCELCPELRRLTGRANRIFLDADYGRRWIPTVETRTTLNSSSVKVERRSLFEWYIVTWRRGFIAEVKETLALLRGGKCPACRGLIRVQMNGGGSMVAMDVPCPACRGTGRTGGVLREIVRGNPVELVEVVDKQPMNEGGWFKDTNSDFTRHNPRYTLPADLWIRCNRMAFVGPHRAVNTAKERLSDALLAEAREESAVPA